MDTDKLVKILGMRWNVKTDTLEYQHVDVLGIDKTMTKREVLRLSSIIFDPLGLITPVTVKAKLFMQELWKSKIDWDEPLNEDLSSKWNKISQDIKKATAMSYPRTLLNTNEKSGTLHVFTDASQLAYGACAYLVTEHSSVLVMAKNRVAPVKAISLPRLELMGAVIGARLASNLQNILNTKTIHMWSDSQIVLSWITSSKKLKPFIENRLTEIRELVGQCEWKYCPTNDNPADYLTRGVAATHLEGNTLWLNGPNWIIHNEKWPTWNRKLQNCSSLSTITEEIVDYRKPDTNVQMNRPQPFIDASRCSSLQRLIRITAYVLRLIRNSRVCKENRQNGYPKLSEFNSAVTVLVKSVQQEAFHGEIKGLKSSKVRNQTTLVRQLKLYLDDSGILRCAGRIHNAPVEEETKYPSLLPTHHSFTALVIADAHKRTHHGGANSTISFIQQKYWIPRIRQAVRSQLRKCVTCRKITGKPYRTPDPPPLPKDRVNYDFPFSVTGVDFTGALITRGKRNELVKSYICLFTCAATRAIHLEIVNDLSEETFMLAFRRFCARRSVPRLILSDNATTFKAAAERISRANRNNRLEEKLSKIKDCVDGFCRIISALQNPSSFILTGFPV